MKWPVVATSQAMIIEIILHPKALDLIPTIFRFPEQPEMKSSSIHQVMIVTIYVILHSLRQPPIRTSLVPFRTEMKLVYFRSKLSTFDNSSTNFPNFICNLAHFLSTCWSIALELSQIKFDLSPCQCNLYSHYFFFFHIFNIHADFCSLFWGVSFNRRLLNDFHVHLQYLMTPSCLLHSLCSRLKRKQW